MSGSKTSTTTLEVAGRKTSPSNAMPSESAASDAAENPLFGVALLKLALEMHKHTDSSVEALTAQVASKMRLDPRAFQTVVTANLRLLTLSQKHKQRADHT
jgi:hypothetical protein